MHWIRFISNGEKKIGYKTGDQVQPVASQNLYDIISGKSISPQGDPLPISKATILAPFRPGKIVAIGLNYMDHCRETNTTPPERPLVFTKFTTSINDPFGDICWSAHLTRSVDYEAELGAVIGKTCWQIPTENALDYIAGYLAANDVSARDLQFGDGQWVRGKSLDTFCPIGPAFVTTDEIPNPQNLALKTILNGQVMQDSNTKEMIFSVAELVSFCSYSFTLEPGDLILTGTPHGVGLGRNPEIYMKDGDVVVVEVEKIGRLENHCRVLS